MKPARTRAQAEARERWQSRTERRPKQHFVCVQNGDALCYHVWTKTERESDGQVTPRR